MSQLGFVCCFAPAAPRVLLRPRCSQPRRTRSWIFFVVAEAVVGGACSAGTFHNKELLGLLGLNLQATRMPYMLKSFATPSSSSCWNSACRLCNICFISSLTDSGGATDKSKNTPDHKNAARDHVLRCAREPCRLSLKTTCNQATLHPRCRPAMQHPSVSRLL